MNKFIRIETEERAVFNIDLRECKRKDLTEKSWELENKREERVRQNKIHYPYLASCLEQLQENKW